MRSTSIKVCYFIGFVICAAMIGFAFYLEYVDYLLPCPLCQLQRITFAIVGALFLIAAIIPVKRVTNVIYGLLIGLFCAIGALLAGRQVYLQHLPAGSHESCSANLTYLLKVFSLDKALAMAIKGTGECAEVLWRFLGLNIAEWTLIVFIVLGLLAFLQMFRAKKSV